MEFRDYYEVLGVPRDATDQAIKKAWRRLARKYHPDVSKEPDAAAQMSAVNEAYTVLSDPQKRAAYDALAQGRRAGERFTPPPDWDEGFEYAGAGVGGADGEAFSDFFAELFGRGAAFRAAGEGGARRGRRGGHAPTRGADHHAHIVLDLADAWRGGQRMLTLRSPHLDASGRVVLAERTLAVNIPRGVRPGQFIRLAGQGEPGTPPGDLFLEVQFRPHPRFRLDGSTVLATLPVAPWEAALGAVVPVELPDGSALNVRVPPGAQSGRVLTVRGRGLPAAAPGDLELTIRVVLPSAHEPRARAIYERMAAELSDFDARKVAAGEAERGEVLP